MEEINLRWKVHVPNLLSEIMTNNETAIFRQPLYILRSILVEIAERSSELNDPVLNALMCRLALYEISDPTSKEYNAELVNSIIDEAERIKAHGKE